MILFTQILFIIHVILGLMVAYLLLLTIAAKRAPKQTALSMISPTQRFVILIPAHNEEKLITNTLENLAKLDYPTGLFSIHVVADNCSDQTANKVRECGIAVYERVDPNRRGKGYALQWLIETLRQNEVAYDAAIILDADSIVSNNFLRVMEARLNRGERVIQAYYSVRDPGHSTTGSLRYAALAAVHFLRPQGRMVLGGSAGLKGNGMVFVADLLKKFPWSASITEDIDQHMSLIINGERVTFAPDAIVLGEMPDTLAKSNSQVTRWESGRLQMAQKYVLPLLKQSLKELVQGRSQRSFILFDAAVEHVIPPFSVLVGLSVGLILIDLIVVILASVDSQGVPGPLIGPKNLLIVVNLLLGFGLLTGQIIYLLTGLKLVDAPNFIYQSLRSAPLFAIWKIWHYLRVLLGDRQQDWVRTPRNKE